MRDTVLIDRSVLDVIREKYDELFPAERRAADYVLEHADESVYFNVSDLAGASGVSDATIIRLVHHLGYSGYYQFRLGLSRDIGKMQLQDAREERTPETPADLPQNAMRPVFERYAEQIAAIGRGLEAGQLLDCVSLIEQADTVHIAAVGNTSRTLCCLRGRRASG